jgi:hypothetical protein
MKVDVTEGRVTVTKGDDSVSTGIERGK